MRFFTILPVLATLACAVSAVPTADVGNDLAGHHDSKRTTGASTILTKTVLASSKKVCKTVKKRAVDELSDVLLARTGSGTNSELDSDGEPTVETDGSLTTLYMKGVDTVPKAKGLSVAGVNGCTAVFFHNAAKTSRTGGHCTGSDEAKIAIKAAKKAKAAGDTALAVIRAPDAATITSVKNAILTVFTPTTWDAKTYPYGQSSNNDNDCFAFTYGAGSTSLEESWQSLQ